MLQQTRRRLARATMEHEAHPPLPRLMERNRPAPRFVRHRRRDVALKEFHYFMSSGFMLTSYETRTTAIGPPSLPVCSCRCLKTLERYAFNSASRHRSEYFLTWPTTFPWK